MAFRPLTQVIGAAGTFRRSGDVLAGACDGAVFRRPLSVRFPAARQHVRAPARISAVRRRHRKPADYSRAPAPKKYEKNEGADVSTVLIMGDSMADWLGYGLEQAFADSPELTVVRKPRAYSSLIYNAVRHDVRNRTDWPAYAREILSKELPAFVVMMIGLGDREPIRDVRRRRRPSPAREERRRATRKPRRRRTPTPAKPGETGQAGCQRSGG